MKPFFVFCKHKTLKQASTSTHIYQSYLPCPRTPISIFIPKQTQKMATSNLEEPITYSPRRNAKDMQKLKCATLQFFNSEAVANSHMRTNFHSGAKYPGSHDPAVWSVKNPTKITKLGYSSDRDDIVLEFHALTSSEVVDGVKNFVVCIEGLVEDTQRRLLYAGGEKPFVPGEDCLRT